MEKHNKNRTVSYILIIIITFAGILLLSGYIKDYASTKRVEYIMQKSKLPIEKYLISITDLSTGNKEMTTIKSYVAETCCIRVITTDNVEIAIPREGKKIVIEEIKIKK